jgi:crotonobetainyl-CoA hydratase
VSERDEAVLLKDGIVRAERIGHVLLITLNRPEARNAMTTELAVALGEAVELLESDRELRAGVLTGAGKAFCAGQDLKELADGGSVIPDVHPEWGFGGFVSHPGTKPIVAAVHGFAFGGGLELALSCDLIVAGSGSLLGLPEVTVGVFAAGGGVPRIAQQLPEKVAARMVLTGKPITAEEAERWGLVNEVAADGEHVAAALQLAEQIAANAPLAVQASKRLLRAGTWSSTWTDEQWPAIIDTFDALLGTEDGVEGPLAFAEKRAPVWKGR